MDSCEFQTAVDNMMEDLVTSLYAVIDDLVIKLRDCFTDLEFQEIDANKMNNNKTKDFLKILKTKSRGTHMRLLDAMESFGCIEIACKLREICERAPGNLSLTEGTADVHVKSIGAVPPSSRSFYSSSELNEIAVLKESYASLCDTITDINELLKYFVTEKIITAEQEEEIKTHTIRSYRVSQLLLIISGPLKAGDSNGFYTMLQIMKTHGVDATQRLANLLITKVDKFKLPSLVNIEVTSSISNDWSKDSELEKCINSLKHSYLKKINQWKTTKWPPRLQVPTFYVDIIIIKAHTLPEKLHKECAMGLVETKYFYVTVEELLQDSYEKVILIEGDPGVGKTTVTLQICKKWAKNKLLKEDIVFWVPLRHFKSVNTVYELFHKLGYPEMMAFAQQNNGKGLVLILDGWDELPNHLQTKSLFHDIIFGTTAFTQSTIIVTSRPTCCVKISEEAEGTNSYYRILGFNQQKAMDYIKAYFKSDPSSGESLLTFLHSHEYLSQDFYIPISVTIMCFVYHSNDKEIPLTLSRLYERFVVLCLRSNISDTQDLEKFKTIHDVPDTVKPIFHKLCMMAYEMLIDDKLLLNEKDMPDVLRLQKFDGFGLLHVDHYHSTFATTENSYSFIHRVVQELLAAIFILTTGSINNIVDNYFKTDSRLMNVFPFLVGLVPKEHLRPLVEELIHFYKSNRNDELLSNKLLFSILHCLFEAHDKKLCREFAQVFNAQENVNLYMHTFLDCHYACYFIATCGIKKLNIFMCRCNFRASTDFYCHTIARYLQGTSIDISSFHFNIYGALSHKGIKEFAKILPAQPNILSLELIGSFVPGCLKILCDSIYKYNPKITNLRLPNGKLSEHDLEGIGFIVTVCKSLKNLYACCQPSEEVCLASSSSFCKALCKTASLIKLVLPWWTLSEDESEVFGNIIRQNFSLEELWINVATVNCLDPIINGLSVNTSITTFRTWPDKTGTSDTLGQCFSNCLCHNNSLKVIDFNDALSMLRPSQYIAWSSTQVSSICAGLCTNITVVTLDISGSYIDTEACHAVCSMLSKNITLQHLFLNPVHLEKEEAIAMISGCKSNSTLKLLSLIQWPQKNLLFKNLFQFSIDEDVEFAIQQMQKLRKQNNISILHIYWKCDDEYDEVKEQILPTL